MPERGRGARDRPGRVIHGDHAAAVLVGVGGGKHWVAHDANLLGGRGGG